MTGLRTPRSRTRAAARTATLAVAAALLLGACRDGVSDLAVPLGRPLPRPDFVLTDVNGRPYDFRRETEGRLTLLMFGYTSCPDICPVHLASIAGALRQRPVEVRVVFVSTDPARDTPARMRDYLGGFDATFVGLRGSDSTVHALEDTLGLPWFVRGEPAARGAFYTVGHSTAVMVVTPDDSVRYAYRFGTRQADWARDLPRLARMRGGR